MGEVVTAEIDGVEFFVEVAQGGPTNVGLDQVLSFSGVSATIEAISRDLVTRLQRIAPDTASVEFSVGIKAKEGKLTGLLVSGGAEAALKVTMTWDAKRAGAAEGGAVAES